MVGSTLAYSLVVERVAGQIVLTDIDLDRARGEARDINHALPFSAPTTVISGDTPDCAGSDVVVITAGAAQKAGESRLSLVERNVDIYRKIIPGLTEVAADAVILIVSNPVDVLTYATIAISGFPPHRVIGSGTVLDTARFRYEIGTHCGIDPRNVHAYILGEHGDTEVAVWSLANLAGVPLADCCATCDRSCPPGAHQELFERVRTAAYDIIRLKGATYYAIALGATRMVEAILRDQKSVVTASTLLNGQYGLRDVCLSLPVVLGADGIARVFEVPLSDEEQEQLKHSASVLRQAIESVGL